MPGSSRQCTVHHPRAAAGWPSRVATTSYRIETYRCRTAGKRSFGGTRVRRIAWKDAGGTRGMPTGPPPPATMRTTNRSPLRRLVATGQLGGGQ